MIGEPIPSRIGAFTRLLSLFLTVLFLNALLPLPCTAEPETTAATEDISDAESNLFVLPEEDAAVMSESDLTDTEPSAVRSNPAPLAATAEDPNFILVEKIFSGLPAERIPDEFRVTVSSAAGGVYTLNRDNTLSRTEDAEGNTVWRWRITGVGTGTYTVSEAGEAVRDYTVTKSGEGTVEVRAADMTVTVPVHKTTCSHTNWPVGTDGDSNVLFAATLTQGGVAVISETPLSAAQRAAVSQAVLKINGPWKTPVYFYSIEEQLQNGTGFELNGATITYDAASEEIIIGQTRNWQHVATLEYSISEASNPELALHNIYRRATAEVTVEKTVTGTMGDREKDFAFTVSVTANGRDAAFSINGTAYTGTAEFSLKHGQSIRLENVPVGAQLTVTEADCTRSRYTVSYAVDHAQEVFGNTATVTAVTAEGHLVAFTNRKEAVPDTGIFTDIVPYLQILGAVILGLAALMLRRRRDRA